MTDNIDEVQRALSAFEAAYNAQDVDRCLAVWAKDLVDIPDGLPLMRGADALVRRREMILGRFQQHQAALRIEPAEFAPLGDVAVLVHGRLTVTMKHRQTQRISHLQKRFMEVWVRGSEGWVIQFEMSNNEPL